MTSARFPKTSRLLARTEFQQVFQAGVVRKDPLLVAYLMPSGRTMMRLGIVVGRGFRGSVLRNRIKRLIREGFRTTRAALPVGLDVILLPRQGARLTLGGIQQSLRRLLAKGVTPGRPAAPRPAGPPAPPPGSETAP